MSILLIILLVLIAWLLWPVVRMALQMRRLHRHMRDTFYGSSQAQSAKRQGTRQHNQDEGTSTRRRPSSYGAEVEYAEFEEVVDPSEVAARNASGSRAIDAARGQVDVVDAEWEDITN